MLTHVWLRHSAFGLAIIFGACWSGSGYESRPLRLTALTVEDTVILLRTPAATYFDVTAIVRNDDSRAMKVASCGPDAQRNIDGAWVTVFTPVCISDVLTPVRPGDSLVIPVHIVGYTNAFPQLDPRMTPGQYRLVFGVFATDSEYPSSSSTSAEEATTAFTVK